ncbi:MAG TPA: Fic family protein [Synergistaceae bacterium]|nr:Fic family protein [Synergistaceae bacterium]
MKTFALQASAEKLLSSEIVGMLTAIHEEKGRQALFVEQKQEALSSLLDVAKIQSTESSNRIEGIYTSDRRLAAIVKDKAEPVNRNESEIAGYRDVLATIHENCDHISLTPNVILQLHRDLYRYSSYSTGGVFKNSDNVIQETDASGNAFIRFQPLSAFETPEAMTRLCESYNQAIRDSSADPLLLAFLFVFDFLCIHPFNDGNGRMSRLLTLLLLYRAGYLVGKYISIEMLIEKTKDTYYEALKASSFGWREEQNDYRPFVEYSLGIVLSAYREFSSRIEYLSLKKTTALERVKQIVHDFPGKVTKKEIMVRCPDLSQASVELALGKLVSSGEIQLIGGGRYSGYVFVHHRDL